MIQTEKAAVVELHVFALVLQFDRVEDGIGRDEARQTHDVQQVVEVDERQAHGRHGRRRQLLVGVAFRPHLHRPEYLYLRRTERVARRQLAKSTLYTPTQRFTIISLKYQFLMFQISTST